MKKPPTKKSTRKSTTTVKRKRTANRSVRRKQQTKTVNSPTATQSPTETKTSKKDTVITLLRREDGATIAELMTSTGWQAHSVRGFISGTLRKQLGLTVVRNQETYRITG